MKNPFDRDDIPFYVLVNDEMQYSLWPTFADIPKGWEIAMEGTRAECDEHIENVWTDMRPRSLAANAPKSV